MTMLFRQLKASMVQLLGDNANGEFRVFGYQGPPSGASEYVNQNRAVRVFYKTGAFPRNASSHDGPIRHEVTIQTEFIVTAKAKVDIAVLEDPESTPIERATALLSSKEAADVADDLFDELVDLVWKIYMNAENIDLGLPANTLGKARWVETIEKDPIITNGEYVILTGEAPLTTSMREETSGETPTAGVPYGNETGVVINEDTVQKTGFAGSTE